MNKPNESSCLAGRRKATVAWLSASATFAVMVCLGVFATDAVKDANGQRLPVIPVVMFTLIVIVLLRKYFNGRYQPGGNR